jgi:hypothetical protein
MVDGSDMSPTTTQVPSTVCTPTEIVLDDVAKAGAATTEAVPTPRIASTTICASAFGLASFWRCDDEFSYTGDDALFAPD